METPNPFKNSKNFLLPKPVVVGLIALILALGIFFRFDNLGKKVFWHDEVFTKLFIDGYAVKEWKQALFTGKIIEVNDLQTFLHFNPRKSLVDTVRDLATQDPHHPPLYYGLARIWIAHFGDSIATLRLLSALLSLLAFPAAYWLCLELFESPRVAWTAVILFAVSPFVVLYAQEAREYALWTALILLSNAALLRALRLSQQSGTRRRGKILAWALYSLVIVLGLYTSFSTALVIAAQSIYILVREKFRFTKITLSFGAALSGALILFLPWVMVLLDHFKTFDASTAWARDTVISRFELLKTLALNISRLVVDFGWDYHHGLTYVAVVLVLLLVAAACFEVASRSPLKSTAIVLILIVVPISILLLPDLIFGGIRSASARYFTSSLIAILLALSFLLATRLAEKKFGRVLAGLIIALGIASCFYNSRLDVTWTKGINVHLDQVAQPINRSNAPLLVGNQTGYNPGTLFALSYRLKPGVKLQLLATEEGYKLPPGFSDIYLLDPSASLRQNLENQQQVKLELVFEDFHLHLWRVVNRKS